MENVLNNSIITALVITSLMGLSACDGNRGENSLGINLPFKDTIRAVGAGASFPAPLYKNWFVLLNQQVPQLQLDFQSVGSGAGIERLTQGVIDFGASDIAMTDTQIAKVSRGVLMLPMTAGSIVLAYNLPGVKDLKLSREAYVDIFSGKITRWNDPKIALSNPGVNLPDQSISVVHRSDGSGTTSVFTNHLSAISPVWKKDIGAGTAVEWPRNKGTFVGGRGNEGVTSLIAQTAGAIGFLEYGFASKSNLTMASLENKAGKFVAPSGESGSKALAQVQLPENLRAFITDPEGDESYPIVTYTWMLLYKKYDEPNKAIAMEAMIQYGLTEGQVQAKQLGYIPLPDNVKERVAAVADTITPDFKINLNPTAEKK
ncbi:MAG: Phosphate-binding protein PstS [Chroococcopsis gigantea SAG 12.99]|jgi:phosphate transport system substrate-binding protein|nr:phosphate ABC transporter substrate-binding protein PstS [Chlorogloea purpurea SAG 13.99]MDV2998542.1 Phosphate-binding protein PstS [Chroococcopsis gigantea SAG 12.99]